MYLFFVYFFLGIRQFRNAVLLFRHSYVSYCVNSRYTNLDLLSTHDIGIIGCQGGGWGALLVIMYRINRW